MAVPRSNPRADRKRVRVGPNLWFNRNGSYEDIRINPATGKQQLTTLKAKTKTEAKQEQHALAVRVDRGEAVAPSRRTVADVAAEFVATFENRVAAGERSPRTLERYRQHLDHHIIPALGRREIQKVSPDVLAQFLSEKRAEGLSAWSRKGMVTPLGRIFALATRRGYISENPLQRLDSDELPKGHNQNEARTLNRQELAALLKHTSAKYRPPGRHARLHRLADPGSPRTRLERNRLRGRPNSRPLSTHPGNARATSKARQTENQGKSSRRQARTRHRHAFAAIQTRIAVLEQGRLRLHN